MHNLNAYLARIRSTPWPCSICHSDTRCPFHLSTPNLPTFLGQLTWRGRWSIQHKLDCWTTHSMAVKRHAHDFLACNLDFNCASNVINNTAEAADLSFVSVRTPRLQSCPASHVRLNQNCSSKVGLKNFHQMSVTVCNCPQCLIAAQLSSTGRMQMTQDELLGAFSTVSGYPNQYIVLPEHFVFVSRINSCDTELHESLYQ